MCAKNVAVWGFTPKAFHNSAQSRGDSPRTLSDVVERLQRKPRADIELQNPLMIFEPLRIGYRWASDRIHRFVIDGMADNAARVADVKHPGALYFRYVEPTADADKCLLAALTERACVVVTNDFPSFFVPRMVAAAASRLPVRLESVDSNGLH